jgi:hypothetical protein
MTTAKVSLNVDIEKLKAEKRLTAKVCCVEGCENIGRWRCINGYNYFSLEKGMCQMHYARNAKHNDPNKVLRIRDGHTKNELFETLINIKARILNKKSSNYSRYGGRGLEMEMRWCEPVYGFQNFIEDTAYLGKRPKGYSLDRIKNEIGYFVGNLRWANSHTQAANTRANNDIVGVYFEIDRNKWTAELTFKGKKMRKRFTNKLDAIAQRKAWEIEYNIYL